MGHDNVKLWDLDNRSHFETLTDSYFIQSLEVIPMKKDPYLASSHDNTIKFWNLGKYTLLKTINVPSSIYSFTTFHNKNVSYLVSGHDEGNIMVWSENVFHVIMKLQLNGSVNLKRRPGLPEDICMYIFIFL